MEIIFLNNGSFKISLTEKESFLTNNILNESIYGIKSRDFEENLGLDKPNAENFFNSFDSSKLEIIADIKEVVFLKYATLTVVKDFILPEFYTRLGVTLGEALEYLSNIIEIIEKIRLRDVN